MKFIARAVILSGILSSSLQASWDPVLLQKEYPINAINAPSYTALKSEVLKTLENSWCSSEKTQLLMDLVSMTHPQICVEIGAFTGSSILPVAAALKFLNLGTIYAIDAWSNSEAVKYLDQNDPNRNWWSQVNMQDIQASFSALIRTWSLQKFCKKIHLPSIQAIHEIPKAIDFLHLDGDYSETGSLSDVDLYLPRVKPGGFILLSNIFIMVNGKQPKLKSFKKLIEVCDVIAEIDSGNCYLFKKRINSDADLSSVDDKLSSQVPLKGGYVVGSLLGQLGNQMFEIATASALAWDNDAEACFPDLHPVSAEYRHVFFRCNRSTPNVSITKEWGNGCPFSYVPIPYQPNMKLGGYLQNEKYFAHHREKILQLFAPSPADLKHIKKKYRHILSHPNSVSVHVRYYYREKPDDESFIQYEREYYEKAMNCFPKDSLFVVISDNIDFAKNNIPTEGRNVLFIEKEPFYIDFYLQTLCKNNIISNSTFSWWGAWLNQNNQKIVIRPQKWLGGYPDINCPADWITIEAKSLQDKLRSRI